MLKEQHNRQAIYKKKNETAPSVEWIACMQNYLYTSLFYFVSLHLLGRG